MHARVRVDKGISEGRCVNKSRATFPSV